MRISIEDLRADLKSLSENISDLSKTISISVLALCWVLLLGGKDAPALPAPVNRYILYFSIIASLLSLITGYLQFVFGYCCSKYIHDDAEKIRQRKVMFDKDSFLYRYRTYFFWGKQFLACLAVLLFIAAMLISMFFSHPMK